MRLYGCLFDSFVPTAHFAEAVMGRSKAIANEGDEVIGKKARNANFSYADV